MLANVLVLGVLSASAYLIYLVVKRSEEREKEGRQPTVLEQYEVRRGRGPASIQFSWLYFLPLKNHHERSYVTDGTS